MLLKVGQPCGSKRAMAMWFSRVAFHLHIQFKSSRIPFSTIGGVFQSVKNHPSPNSVDAMLTDR